MRIVDLIAKLEKLPHGAYIERHNGEPWVRLGPGRYQRLADIANPRHTPVLNLKPTEKRDAS